MKYISTRGKIDPIDFQDAVLMGLADDGGLIIPENIPKVASKLATWAKVSYQDLALQIFKLFVADIPHADLQALVHKSYADNFPQDVAPLVKVGGMYILELFHGPTLAFKDMALQFLGNLFAYILEARQTNINILGATSGDTGSAAIYGVRGRKNINIFMMHPHKKVSIIQQKQMTTVLDPNVYNIAVKGSFDDCQRIMKEIAGDLAFKRKHQIAAVNSVNWCRVMAQIVYYFHAVLRLQKAQPGRPIEICVPTGNFGNILAAWIARQMGLPIAGLILATNENDILSRLFNNGVYALGEQVYHTLSPAMDIQVSSNLERYLYYKLGQDPVKLSAVMKEFSQRGRVMVAEPSPGRQFDDFFKAGKAERQEVLGTIKKYYEQHNYILDPHSAVGVFVAEKLQSQESAIVSVATAHPAKFPAAIKEATGKELARHPDIDRLNDLPDRCALLENDRQEVMDFIKGKIS